ncbi:MAG: hypothetical protein P9X27_01165 [Candidatus Kaelpia aquatica]|nr:hypothetical protein [Candidatus Kaelpia aquatica]
MCNSKIFFYLLLGAAVIFTVRIVESSASSPDGFLGKLRTVISNQEKIDKKIAELEPLLEVIKLRVAKAIRL